MSESNGDGVHVRPLGELGKRMARGHLMRKGHALTGVLVSSNGELWRIARSCCPD